MDMLTAFAALLAALVLLVGPWVVFALLALRFGVDSRLGLHDDHRHGASPTAWI